MEEFLIKKRDINTHKGDYGRVLVVAGSKGMAGAAMLCGKAAIKSGAGLVRFAVPDEIVNILQVGLPEATCLPRDFEEAINLHDYEAVALGPGLGMTKDNISMIKTILNEYTGKLILDADGLNCVMRYKLYGNLIQSNAEVILTPHMGEAKRLLEVETIDDRDKAAQEIAESFNSTVVMKGHNTLVVSPDGQDFYRNNTGNPGMATGGAGDVLSGVIAGLAAQGFSSFEAAKIGVYVHGLSGDICAEELGQLSMTAMDIVQGLPKAYKRITEV